MTTVPKDARVFVAGHAGLVGSAVRRKLKAEGYANLLVARRDQLDLRDQAAVNYGSGQTGPSTCSSSQARSVASWRTPPAPRSSSTTT